MNMEQKTEKWDAIAYSICKVTAQLYVGISAEKCKSCNED